MAEATGDRPAGERPATAGGPGRVLVAVYGVFALAAGARAAVQLSTRFAEAPVAYLLSALAAAIYVVATVALARGGPWTGPVRDGPRGALMGSRALRGRMAPVPDTTAPGPPR